jgi:uncharacterized membrane-anchored protein
MLNKVPEVTLWFWVIKILCTTVGETAADFLNVNLNFGLTGTSIVTGVLVVLALVVQFRADRYVPARYWLTVLFVSVFGTLVTDNLTDAVGVPLEASTVIFSVLVALTFLGWYLSEGTLSIHAVVTRRREAFYWLAILFTFALGTATGDLMAEVLGLGYLVTGAIVAALIAAIALAWRAGLHPVLGFWIIYVLTRPLGASIGDYLSQPSDQGGLGLGATITSLIFVVAIVAIVSYLTVTKADVIEAREGGDAPAAPGHHADRERGGLLQTVVVVVLILVAATVGYTTRKASLQDDATAAVVQAAPAGSPAGTGTGAGPAARTSPLGDVSSFRTITQDTLDRLDRGDQAGATTRVDDLETAWDDAEARLKPRNPAEWNAVDGKIDTVLRELRATTPDPASEKAALDALLAQLS